MEKLIELLNEYEKYISLGGLADWREFDGNLHYYSNSKDEYVFDNVYYRIISKNYGFIQWLVKNDKVDSEKLDTPEYIDLGDDFMKLSDSNYITMILSIQDNPIEYLCSILKE